MKNVLLFISFLFLLLAGSKVMDFFVPVQMEDCASVRVEAIDGYEEYTFSGCILPVESESPHGEAITDAQLLARQLSMHGRTTRVTSVNYSYLSKVLVWKAVRDRMEVLSQAFSRTYTTLPYQSWMLSSDYYVFGMRRILI